jgi:hypothetical protein
MSLNSADHAAPSVYTGTFTSASTAVAVTEAVPFQPSCVILFVDISGTNPNWYIQTSAYTVDSQLVTGTTGIITTPAVASGISITSAGFSVPAAQQVNSGVNFYIAFR